VSDSVLEINDLHKHFDGVVALAGFSCTVREREILGLIGPNGSGKTTLFNVIGGFLTPDSGNVVYRGSSVVRLTPHRVAAAGVARTFQDLRLVRQLSVLDNVLLSFRNQPGERLANIFFRWSSCKSHETASRKKAMLLLEDCGLAEKANDPAEDLSYGQQKLLSLVCCLAAKADLLLLDEPVAGIAPEMVDRILRLVRDLPSRGKSVILIEHDLDAMMQVCDRVVFMGAGAKVVEGTFEEVRNTPRVIEAYLG